MQRTGTLKNPQFHSMMPSINCCPPAICQTFKRHMNADGALIDHSCPRSGYNKSQAIMKTRKVKQPIIQAERFTVTRYASRAHQRDQPPRWRPDGDGGTSGECRILVQGFKPVTPQGQALLNGATPKPSKFVRGF